ncbi:hypothetical protein GA0115255_109796, partial [Streptomyces sp. Ncost-T6T-2b]
MKGAAREQLECVATAGNGRYYDAPDADALARRLQWAAQLAADGYRFAGRPVPGRRRGGEHRPNTLYDGRPAVAGAGSVPVAWTNRYESRPTVRPVHAEGDFLRRSWSGRARGRGRGRTGDKRGNA